MSNEGFSHLLSFGERPELFPHGRSFLVSDLSKALMVVHFWWVNWAICSHHSWKKREWACESLGLKKTYQKIKFQSNFLSESLILLFIMSNLGESLICHERPEQFAHCHSFNMSDLIDSLTVPHLSCAIWANRSQSLIWFERSEQMSKWAMSEWANSQPWKICCYYRVKAIFHTCLFCICFEMP